MYEIVSMFAVDREAVDVFLKKWAIPHSHAGRGVFAGSPIGARKVVEKHYWSFQYFDLGE